MSIPLDEIYHYINDCLDDDAIIYRFFPHGSKNINNLLPISQVSYHDKAVLPVIICHDQEPLNFDWYELSNNQDVRAYVERDSATEETVEWLPSLNLSVVCLNNHYQKRILLHSELNSIEVQKYVNTDLFVPVFWWSHALIARDWFRYAEFDPQSVWPKKTNKIVNVYCRAWSGTREYRLFVLDKLKHVAEYCNIKFNPYDENLHYTDHIFKNKQLATNLENFENIFQNYERECPTMSASYTIYDYKNSLFDCVLETVADDDRIHLTEKTLRPIALGQPFIIAAGPGTLKFLQDNGFKTFGDVIDESYDSEKNHVKRLQMITELISDLCKKPWSQSELQILQEIAEHNRRHFFSQEFYNKLLKDLKLDLMNAIKEVKRSHDTYWYEWAEKILSRSNKESMIFHCQRWLNNWDEIYQRLKLIPKNKIKR